METVSVADARRARSRDPETGSYLYPERAARLSAQYVVLFDPADVNGNVRLDGEGKPSTSFVIAADVENAIRKGFTEKSPRVSR
jgi:hypothetical protein